MAEQFDLLDLPISELKKTLLKIGLTKEVIKIYEKKFTREYRSLPKNYLHPIDLSKLLFGSCFFPDKLLENNSINIAIFAIINAIVNEEIEMPWYWLEKQLATDLDFSSPPESIANIALPPKGLIILPDNFLFSSTGIVRFMAYRLFKPGEPFITDIQHCDRFTGKTKIASNVTTFVGGEGYKLCYWGAESTGCNNGGIANLEITGQELIISHQDTVVWQDAEKDKKDASRVLGLLLNTLTYSTNIERTIDRVGTKKGFGANSNPSKYRLPLWIGEGYKSAVYQHLETEKKERNSPHPHYRRGHWRRVAIGEKRSDRAWRFIAPTIVGLGGEDSTNAKP